MKWGKFKVLLIAHRNVRFSSSIHSSKSVLHRGMHSTRKRPEKDQVCLIAKAWYHWGYQGTQWTEQICWKLDLSSIWSQLGLFTWDFQREMNLTWYVRRIKTLNDCWFLAKICLLSDKLLITVMLHVKNSKVIKVPISSKVLFAHLILYFMQWTSLKKERNIWWRQSCHIYTKSDSLLFENLLWIEPAFFR